MTHSTENARCPQADAHGPDGIIECWNPGGPCPAPNDPACESCGPCSHLCALTLDDWRRRAEEAEAELATLREHTTGNEAFQALHANAAAYVKALDAWCETFGPLSTSMDWAIRNDPRFRPAEDGAS